MIRFVWSAVVALVVLVSCGAAFAQSEPDAAAAAKAEELWSAGSQAYSAGQFLVAAEAFDKSYALFPHSSTLFSGAQAHKKQYFVDQDPAHLRKAVSMYRAYLKKVDKGARRSDAVAAVSELAPYFERLTQAEGQAEQAKKSTRVLITAKTAGAVISVDGGSLENSPLVRTVTAGKHNVVVRAPGYFDDEREVLAVQGELVVVDVTLRGKPARLQVEGDSGIDVSVDGRVVASLPLEEAIELPAGEHVVAFTRRGHEGIERALKLKHGMTAAMEVNLPTTTQRKVSYAGVSLGLAGAVATGILSGVAVSKQGEAEDILDQLEQNNSMTKDDVVRYEQLVADRDRFVEFATATGAVTGGVLLSSLGLYLFDNAGVMHGDSRDFGARPRDSAEPPGEEPSFTDDETRTSQSLKADFWFVPGSFGGGLSGRF